MLFHYLERLNTTLKELNDKEDKKLIGLIRNLKIYEMEQKAREKKALQKKKTLAFKTTPSTPTKKMMTKKMTRIYLSL